MKPYVKKLKLNDAPKPTLPVHTKVKPSTVGLVSDKYRKKAVHNAIATRSNLWTYEEIHELKKCYRQGLSMEEIAKRFPNRTYAAVNSRLRRMRKRGEL